MSMRRSSFTVFCFVLISAGLLRGEREADSGRAATPGELIMLSQAVQKTAGELENWAYTETSIMRDEKGKTKGETIVRYDPSKRYEEQWTPIKVNGHAPTDKDLAKYRRRGETTRKRDENQSDGNRRSLGELIELEGARVASENDRQLTFEIPLRKQNNVRFPPEKFLVLARLNKELKSLENVSVQL